MAVATVRILFVHLGLIEYCCSLKFIEQGMLCCEEVSPESLIIPS